GAWTGGAGLVAAEEEAWYGGHEEQDEYRGHEGEVGQDHRDLAFGGGLGHVFAALGAQLSGQLQQCGGEVDAAGGGDRQHVVEAGRGGLDGLFGDQLEGGGVA